jgi:hypothetical protein
MNLDVLRTFFGWCSVINGALLLLTFANFAFAGDGIHGMHGKWFPISREAFTLTMCCFIGGMKILFLMLNLVPYLALVLLG